VIAMQPELKLKLKLALAGRTSVEMGQFQFLNLEEVRAQAGADWESLRTKIYEVSGHFIEKRLDADDVMFRCQGGYLIIFATLKGDAPAQRIAEISRELNAFFLGEGSLERVRVSGDARSVSTAEFLEIIARDEAQARRPSAPPAEPVAHASAGRRMDKVHQPGRITDADRVAWVNAETDSEPAPAPPRWTQADKRPGSTPWQDMVFKPCWDARSNAVTHHLCLARRMVNGFPAYGRETFAAFDSKPLNRLLDHSVAVAAQRGYQKLHAQGGSGGLIIPVHYDTIASLSDRMSYFAILQAVPVPIRRHFLFRLDAIPDGAPVAQMQELFRSMMPFGSRLMARLKYGVSDLRRFEGSGVSIFCTEIPFRLGEGEVSTTTIETVLSLVTQAQDLRADTFLTQIESADLLGATVSAGVRYFCGDLIGTDRPAPTPAHALEFNEIIQRPRALEDESDVVHI
tara:strand:+ start:12358 stop:13728 length:1371 start_codon:yes stop_codon:yes gene_type:complete